MKQFFKYSILSLLAVVIGSCKKEVTQPTVTNISGHKVYSAAELNSIATCTNSCAKRFTQDVYFIGVVVADEQSGNFYKEIYVRDRYNTGAMRLDFTQRSSFFIGDSVRVNLKGLDVNLNVDTDILEIDSLDYEKFVIKFASGAKPQPRVLSIAQMNSNLSTYLGDLVQLTNVAFTPTDANQYWSDPIGQYSLNRTIQDCDGSQLIVRTSNFADFALEKTPTGNGTLMGIATAYQGTSQLAIRNTAEANMNGTGCTIYIKKDFEDNSLTSGGWTQQSVLNGSILWTASSFGSDKFGKISGYLSGNTNSENWLISPAINLAASANPVLSFRTAAKFAGDQLELWISTNYSSGAPSTATWTQLTGFALSPNNPGNYAWTASGSISLNAYKNANTRFAYKYKSTTAGSTTYEVDDVIVKEN
ncbi:MAG: choice-of-anchor J domain-containing protein [Sphingobacteriaceae bacterium]|nr:choice-of-anchor J domain-containing protein [Sphingobacteriaceae bacterium]